MIPASSPVRLKVFVPLMGRLRFCVEQLFQVPRLHVTLSKGEIKSYQRAVRPAPTFRKWQILKKNKNPTVRPQGDASHHFNVCQFDFSFRCQGRDTTCWGIWFYVRVYGHVCTRDPRLSDSEKRKRAQPTATPLRSLIIMTTEGRISPVSPHPLCFYSGARHVDRDWQVGRGISDSAGDAWMPGEKEKKKSGADG